jgi:hypothetical protein
MNTTNITNKITMTDSGNTVLIYSHADRPNLKVNLAPDAPRDPKSRWGAFAHSCGSALRAFEGKTYKSQKSAEKAIVAFLDTKAAETDRVKPVVLFVASTGDDVLTWA